VAGRDRARRKQARGAAPYLVTIGGERCRERFLHVRRPMFDRLQLQGNAVVALPRRGTKSARPVAFELAGGRELDPSMLPVDEPSNEDRVRLEYRSSPVGRGPSEIRLLSGASPEPWRTLELPDAISAVPRHPLAGTSAAETASCTHSSERALSAGAGRRPGLPPSARRVRARSTSGPVPIDWPRTAVRRSWAGSEPSGRSARRG
jgi:hypothetical protein